MSDKEKTIYCAALLEGEGSFVKKSKYSMVVQCNMTDLDVLKKLKEYAGGSICASKNRNPNKWKDSWVWTLTGDSAENLALRILPYMGERRSKRINDLVSTRQSRRKSLEKFNSTADNAAILYINSSKSLRQVQRETGVNRQTILRHKIKLEM